MGQMVSTTPGGFITGFLPTLLWGAMAIVIMLLPVLGVLTMILVLFGQQPDSIILAFTKTSDWILSGDIRNW